MDFNNDGDTSDPGEVSLPNVSDRDWLDDSVTHFPSCTSPLTNRSTKYDWLRFFWDLPQSGVPSEGVGNVHPNTVAWIWDRANPKNWLPHGSGPSGHVNMPGIRILDACDDENVLDRCDDQLFNGISHGTAW